VAWRSLSLIAGLRVGPGDVPSGAGTSTMSGPGRAPCELPGLRSIVFLSFGSAGCRDRSPRAGPGRGGRFHAVLALYAQARGGGRASEVLPDPGVRRSAP
jgi:hypothetical protein